MYYENGTPIMGVPFFIVRWCVRLIKKYHISLCLQDKNQALTNNILIIHKYGKKYRSIRRSYFV